MEALSVIASELTFAVRRLAADRWAAGAAILATAIGAGLNTAVFAVAYGILLRPLSYKDPARLGVMDVVNRTSNFEIGVRLPEFDEWQRSSRSFDGMAAYVANDLVVRGAGDPRLVHGAIVTGTFFNVLAASPLDGRFFTTDRADDTLIVVSDRLAHALFGDIEAAVGRRLFIGGAAVTISGIASRAVGFPADETDIWCRRRRCQASSSRGCVTHVTTAGWAACAPV